MSIDKEKESIRRDLKMQPPMKADVKERWVAALRSGKYKQGQGFLRRDTVDGVCHCCLGVLAEEEGGCDWHYQNLDGVAGVYTLGITGAAKFLTTGMMEEFGLRRISTRALATCNDHSTLSFEDIADAIEECL